ncbi:MAG TPA: homoserine kinase [Myxococcaceae bacterium]|nr:homoserine kinase [Myxococcaceae bacterium]
MEPFRVRVPATTSNLGPGFDCFGLALSLHFEVEVRPSATLTLTSTGADVPLDATNLVVTTLRDHLPPGTPLPPLALHLHNRIPLARGLGSSACARIAGLAIAEVLTHGLSRVDRERVCDAACALEGHPDNATPAVHGGFCVGATGRGHERVELDGRRYVVLIPQLEIRTADAREALPKQVRLGEAVFNLQRASLSALRIARAGHLGGALPFEDQLHQRYRLALDARLQRAFARMEQLTEVEGAFLSGSGSTLMALAKAGEEEAARQSCLRVLQEEGLTADAHLLSADNQGLIIERL